MVLGRKLHWIKSERLAANIIQNTQSFLVQPVKSVKKSMFKQYAYKLQQLSWRITDDTKIKYKTQIYIGLLLGSRSLEYFWKLFFSK